MDAPRKYDYTSLSSFLRCRRRYYFRHVRNIVGKGKQLAPEFGRWIHKALDIWHKEHDIDKAIQIFKNGYVGDDSDDKRTIPVGEKLLKLYADKYAHEGFTVLKSEITFDIPIVALKDELGDINLIGRIDKIIEWDGAIYVCDHKTTSRLGYEFFYKIKPNMQFDGYIIAARHLGYSKCNGILLDALLVAKGLLVPSQLTKLTPLARDVSTRSEGELLTYLCNVCDIIKDIYSCYKSNQWYQNTEACCDFIQCPYRLICKEDRDVQERIIESDYKVEPWSPLEEVA